MWATLRPTRRGLLVPLALLVGTILWEFGRGVRAADPVLARARSRGSLIAGVPLWLPPFGAPVRQGGWAGLDVALARQVAEAALGSPEKAHMLPLTPGERLWAVRSGAADLVTAALPSGGAETPSGLALVGPYFTDAVALLVRRARPVPALGALDGQVVGVLPGGAGAAALRAAAGTGATPVLHEVEGAGVAAREVALGGLRAIVAGEAVCRALARFDAELRVQPLPVLGREAHYVLVQSGARELGEAVHRAIGALPRGGALAAALSAWAAGAEGPSLPRP